MCIVVIITSSYAMTLRWVQNGRDNVSNHHPHDCLFNRLLRRRSKKTSKLCVTGICVENSPGPVNSPHKGPVTWKMFPFDDVIMRWRLPLQTITTAMPIERLGISIHLNSFVCSTAPLIIKQWSSASLGRCVGNLSVKYLMCLNVLAESKPRHQFTRICSRATRKRVTHCGLVTPCGDLSKHWLR